MSHAAAISQKSIKGTLRELHSQCLLSSSTQLCNEWLHLVSMLGLDIANSDTTIQCTNHHERAYPHVLLQHRLLVQVPIQRPALQIATVEPVSKSSGPFSTCRSEAFWVQISNAVDGRVTQFGNSEVEQDLCIVGEAFFVKKLPKHTVLHEDKVFASMLGRRFYDACEVVVARCHVNRTCCRRLGKGIATLHHSITINTN
mmetsp:Transcript_71146/g.123406  ORF Transcript_71146/g.123406 Transcript_71146/m.123406 type:complete len:200 (+) Transcript_71146:264-863(+)